MTFDLSWGTTLPSLDSPLPMMPSEFDPIFPATTSEPAFDGSEIVTGLEGRRAVFAEIGHERFYLLYLRAGGAGVYTVDGYIRCPKSDDDQATETWEDYTCKIHMPRGYRQHKLWSIRLGLVVLITDMEYLRASVLTP